jgi:hypothetical protein
MTNNEYYKIWMNIKKLIIAHSDSKYIKKGEESKTTYSPTPPSNPKIGDLSIQQII